MTNMEKMLNVMEAYESTKTAKKLQHYLDEIENYIEQEVDYEEYIVHISKLREYIVDTNEINWQNYFIKPVTSEQKCFCSADSCTL